MTATLMTPGLTPETDAIVDQLRSAFEECAFTPLLNLYAPDALLTAVVPHWRFQVQGAEAIVAEFREYHAPLRLVDWRVDATASGALVELALFTGSGPDECFTRQAHILSITGGEIVEHRLFCSGIWPMETVERHRVEELLITP